MATNLELKASLASIKGAREQAAALGGVSKGTLLQSDTYFRVPRGRLKLRECVGSGSELIYYERDEVAPERWSHYVKEPVGNPEGLWRVLEKALGVRAVVDKKRDLYLYKNARIHIDEVAGLGTFIEFEVQGNDPAASMSLMKELRECFGVRTESVIRASYGEMMEEASAKSGKPSR